MRESVCVCVMCICLCVQVCVCVCLCVLCVCVCVCEVRRSLEVQSAWPLFNLKYSFQYYTKC